MAYKYVSDAIARRVRQRAQHRCGYCLSPQQLIVAELEIVPIVPVFQGGRLDERNLWLVCPLCLAAKRDQIAGRDPLTGERTRLFNPCKHYWGDHFRWRRHGIYVVGITSVGSTTVHTLKLNDALQIQVRRDWIEAGLFPPEDTPVSET